MAMKIKQTLEGLSEHSNSCFFLESHSYHLSLFHKSLFSYAVAICPLNMQYRADFQRNQMFLVLEFCCWRLQVGGKIPVSMTLNKFRA